MTKKNIEQNQPLSYDYHGSLELKTRFSKIKNQDIDIYLDLDTTIGKNACEQNCSHCWFVNYDKVKNKKFDILEGKQIFDSLKTQGFKVYPRYTDSFAYNGELMKIYGTSRNRSFKEGITLKDTKTMEKGEAWTSGKPLLSDNSTELLQMALDYNYGAIAITFHGILNDKLEIKDEYPISGVFHGQDFEKVEKIISKFNKNSSEHININIGITIGRHNNTKEMLLRYIKYFNQLPIKTLRFNNFYNHGENYEHLVLLKEERKQFFSDIEWLHEYMKINFQLAVSEDFGTDGYEVLNYPKNIGLCKAGHQLFAIIPIDKEVISNVDNRLIEKIGSVVGCVNTFEPELGSLYKTSINNKADYKIEFDHGSIEKLQEKRVSKTFENGCFSKELNSAIKLNLY